jgi:hypothetical protein
MCTYTHTVNVTRIVLHTLTRCTSHPITPSHHHTITPHPTHHPPQVLLKDVPGPNVNGAGWPNHTTPKTAVRREREGGREGGREGRREGGREGERLL